MFRARHAERSDASAQASAARMRHDAECSAADTKSSAYNMRWRGALLRIYARMQHTCCAPLMPRSGGAKRGMSHGAQMMRRASAARAHADVDLLPTFDVRKARCCPIGYAIFRLLLRRRH